MNRWYALTDPASLDTPCLVVHPDRVARNIANMVSIAGDASRLRPHIKTHKTHEGVRMMMDAGISKFKCATISEAELLGLCKAPDVLLAYQPHGPKVARLVELVGRFPETRYACLVDNRSTAEHLSDFCMAKGIRMPVYLDLNLGMNRTGISPGSAALELYAYCHTLPGILTFGLHAYDGHHRHIDAGERARDCDKTFILMQSMCDDIVAKGLPRPVLVAGGSPTFPIHAKRKDVECSPGTNIFWDGCYSQICSEQPFEPAVALVARVLSLPTEDRVCLDVGHKSVAAENEITRRLHFPDHPGLVAVSQSEEHLVMQSVSGHGLRPGDVLYGIPYHICPTVALHERLHVAKAGRIEGEWKVVARDRRIGT
jgi:D-serine deaminase-like pyridoxal phosphate-dependent protein